MKSSVVATMPSNITGPKIHSVGIRLCFDYSVRVITAWLANDIKASIGTDMSKMRKFCENLEFYIAATINCSKEQVEAKFCGKGKCFHFS